MKQLITISIITILIVSCAKSKLTTRYKEMEVKELPSNEINKYIKINAFSFDVGQSSANKSIFDLSEKAQANLIGEVSKKSKSNEEIFSTLDSKFTSKPKVLSDISKLVFTKRVVISVEDIKGINGADRIESFTATIIHEKNNLEFQYWDKIVTKYQEIDIGKISYSNTGGFSVSPNITMGGTIQGAAPISANYSATTIEEVQLNRKIPLTTGALQKDRFSVSRKSTPREDISGNILVEVKFKVLKSASKTVYSFEGLYDKNEPIKDNTKVKVKKINFEIADLEPSESEVKLNLNFVYREVTSGEKTETESDDKVIFLISNDSTETESVKFNLLNDSDLDSKFWLIRNGVHNLTILSNSVPDNLRFGSFSDASIFLEWLKATRNTEVGSLKIGFYKEGSFLNLLSEEIAKLMIEIEE